MKFSNRFLTGSALCLLMAAPSAHSANLADAQAPLVVAQAEAPAAPGADCPPGTTASADGCAPIERAPAPAEEEAGPSEEAAPPVEEAPRDEAPAQEAPEPAAPEQAPATQDRPSAPPAPDTPPPGAEEPPVEQAPPVEAPPASEDAPALDQAPADEPEASPASPPVDAAPDAPADEAPATPDQAAPEAPADASPSQAEPETQGEPAPEAPVGESPAGEAPADSAPAGTPDSATESPTPRPGSEPSAVPPAAPLPGQEQQEQGQTGESLPENAAPVLDSQKETDTQAPEASRPDQQSRPGQPAQPGEAQQPEGQAPDQEQAAPAPLPQSDAEAQQLQSEPAQILEEIRSAIEEPGQRIELGQTPQDRSVRRRELFERRDNGNVIQEFNDNRTIFEMGDRRFIRNSDYDRLVRRDDTVYYEQLRDGRVREVVERRNGSRLVTVRNRYGDVIRRVRVLPDGQEVVMVYVPEDRYDRSRPFVDPGRELPPLRLTIPVDEYILDAGRVDDPQAYYTFLAEPPVEQVERLYTLDEVRYSARIRDKVRRIDLDTIEFDSGSATISRAEAQDLESLASAMIEMLENNPAETFLLEGHTDAVGSDTFNLALSDRRAEAVAIALTDMFNIPPENLVTQGYGEQYLKIRTEAAERENRRVAVRRITPLVTPVARR